MWNPRVVSEEKPLPMTCLKMHCRYYGSRNMAGFFVCLSLFSKGERSTATVLSKKEYFYVTVKSFITWLIILLNLTCWATKIKFFQDTQFQRKRRLLLQLDCRIVPHVQKPSKKSKRCLQEGPVPPAPWPSVQLFWSSTLSTWRRMPLGLHCALSLELICWCWLNRYEKHFNLYVWMQEQTCVAFQPSVT